MRPPAKQAENVSSRIPDFHSPEGFNEAACKTGGKRNAFVVEVLGVGASMRPPAKQAENPHPGEIPWSTITRFDEAACKTGGKLARPCRPASRPCLLQ